MSTLPSETTDWLLRPAEAPDDEPHRACFQHWVSSGERNDYAAVVIDPPWLPTETGIVESLCDVVIAPRHRGVSLRSASHYPVDVYVLTVPELLKNASTVPPDAFKIRLWALLDRQDPGKVRRGRTG